MGYMSKAFKYVVIVSGLSVCVLFPGNHIWGASFEEQITNVEKDIESTKKEHEDTKTQLDALRNQDIGNRGDLLQIDETLTYTMNRMGILEKQIATMSRDVERTALELRSVEKRMDKNRDIADNRLRYMYMYGSTSYVDLVANSENFSDLLNRIALVRMLVDADQEVLKQQAEDLALVEEKKNKIESKLDEIKKTSLLMERMKSVLEEEKVDKTNISVNLKTNIEDLEQTTEEQIKLLADLAREKSRLISLKEREEMEAARASSIATNTGKFQYPLESEYAMTSDYGYRVHPVTHELNKFHAGMDIGAPQGTHILAAETGVVLVAGEQSGYGNVVIIDHGQGVWSVYGHIMNNGIHVSEGDQVARGQYIADVGSTGRSTGPHLHFEIRVDGEPTDPKPYIQ